MAVTGTQLQISYATDGRSTNFAVLFYFVAFADLFVQFTDAAGIVHNMVLNTDYTVTGVLNTHLGAYDQGGTVIFIVAPATGGTVLITRQTPIVQSSAWNDLDPFPAGTQEAAFDRLTLIAQEIAAGFVRG